MRYLFITYVKKPDGKIDELISVGKNVRKRDNQLANVIIDFKERKVIKCIIDGSRIDTDFDQLYIYYQKIYPAIIERLSQENGYSGEIISPQDEQVIDKDPKYVQ